MHAYGWRIEPVLHHRSLDPQHDVVTCPSVVVAEVVIQAELLDVALLEQSDGLVRPTHQCPSFRWNTLIIEVDANHVWLTSVTISCDAERRQLH